MFLGKIIIVSFIFCFVSISLALKPVFLDGDKEDEVGRFEEPVLWFEDRDQPVLFVHSEPAVDEHHELVLNHEAVFSSSEDDAKRKILEEYAIESERTPCEDRETCFDEGLSFSLRNCYCDFLCIIFNDCCSDAAVLMEGTKFEMQSLTPDVVSCQKLRMVKSNAEYSLVNRCSASYKDDYVKRRCEDDQYSSDLFFKVYVTSKSSGIVYKNVYCAVCHGDQKDVQFWQVVRKCPAGSEDWSESQIVIDSAGAFQNVNSTLPESCQFEIIPPAKMAPRKCKSHISHCPSSWQGARENRLCSPNGVTALRYHGGQVFKNRHCAVCNGIDEEELACKDNSSALFQFDLSGKTLDDAATATTLWMVTDLTDVTGVMKSPYKPNEKPVKLGLCRESGQFFDPFTVPNKCRRVMCSEQNHVFWNGKCTEKTTIGPKITPKDAAKSFTSPKLRRITKPNKSFSKPDAPRSTASERETTEPTIKDELLFPDPTTIIFKTTTATVPTTTNTAYASVSNTDDEQKPPEHPDAGMYGYENLNTAGHITEHYDVTSHYELTDFNEGADPEDSDVSVTKHHFVPSSDVSISTADESRNHFTEFHGVSVSENIVPSASASETSKEEEDIDDEANNFPLPPARGIRKRQTTIPTPTTTLRDIETTITTEFNLFSGLEDQLAGWHGIIDQEHDASQTEKFQIEDATASIISSTTHGKKDTFSDDLSTLHSLPPTYDEPQIEIIEPIEQVGEQLTTIHLPKTSAKPQRTTTTTQPSEAAPKSDESEIVTIQPREQLEKQSTTFHVPPTSATQPTAASATPTLPKASSKSSDKRVTVTDCYQWQLVEDGHYYTYQNGSVLVYSLDRNFDIDEIKPVGDYEEDEFETRDIEVCVQRQPDKVLKPAENEIKEGKSLHEGTGLHRASDVPTAFEPLVDLLIMFRYHKGAHYLHLIFVTISIICLAATLITLLFYSCRTKAIKTMGRILSFGLAMISAQIFFIIAYVTATSDNAPDSDTFKIHPQTPALSSSLCFWSGVLFHYLVLAAACWINVFVVAFVRREAKINSANGQGEENTSLSVQEKPTKGASLDRSFRFYSLYAWLCPMLPVFVSLVIDLAGGRTSGAASIRPFYGQHMICFLTGKNALWIFLAFPILILTVVNLVLLIITCFRKIKSKTISSPDRSSQFSFKLKLFWSMTYTILFFVTWMIAFTSACSYRSTGQKSSWLIFDFFHFLLGLTIFIGFFIHWCFPRLGCRRTVLHINSSGDVPPRVPSASSESATDGLLNGHDKTKNTEITALETSM